MSRAFRAPGNLQRAIASFRRRKFQFHRDYLFFPFSSFLNKALVRVHFKAYPPTLPLLAVCKFVLTVGSHRIFFWIGGAGDGKARKGGADSVLQCKFRPVLFMLVLFFPFFPFFFPFFAVGPEESEHRQHYSFCVRIWPLSCHHNYQE